MWIEMHSLIFASGVGGSTRSGGVKWERGRRETDRAGVCEDAGCVVALSLGPLALFIAGSAAARLT
jgi:hypothetical protein